VLILNRWRGISPADVITPLRGFQYFGPLSQ
jgi:hypothetical protein